MALPYKLLEAARNYLDITWPDDDGDKKLAGILGRGIKYIDRVCGVPQDYSFENKPRELLFDYCRYARDSALNSFAQDYIHELVALQIDSMVEQHGD